jgi:hypothetical protein
MWGYPNGWVCSLSNSHHSVPLYVPGIVIENNNLILIFIRVQFTYIIKSEQGSDVLKIIDSNETRR